MKTLGHAYVDTCMCTHALDLRVQASCMHTHKRASVRINRHAYAC